MLKIHEYQSFQEKADYFHKPKYSFIEDNARDTIQTIEQWIDSYKKESIEKGYNYPLFFRGVSEAKYMLYSYAQREYHWYFQEFYPPSEEGKSQEDYFMLLNKHYDTFITYTIEETVCCDQQKAREFFESANISEGNILGYMSYMQHYSIPTPLADFTNNFYKALFFAIYGHDEITHKSPYIESQNEIENYVSIYLVQGDAVTYQMVRKFFPPDFHAYRSNRRIEYEKLAKSRMLLFLEDDRDYEIQNNRRIINQEGIFIFNSSTTLPLEFQFIETKLYAENFYKKNTGQSLYRDKEAEYLSSKMAFCFHLHKKLIPEIRDILKEKGIRKSDIYPDQPLTKDSIMNKVKERMKELKW